MENPIKMDDLGVPLFLETSIYSKRTTTYPWNIPKRPPTVSVYGLECISFGAERGCLGYVPGVCWKILRYMDVEPKIGVVKPPKWMVKISWKTYYLFNG